MRVATGGADCFGLHTTRMSHPEAEEAVLEVSQSRTMAKERGRGFPAPLLYSDSRIASLSCSRTRWETRLSARAA